jgi:hypothetical protein
MLWLQPGAKHRAAGWTVAYKLSHRVFWILSYWVECGGWKLSIVDPANPMKDVVYSR